MAEPWVSVEDVAAHLGVRKESVYRWIEHRGLPATKIGKLWKLKFSEVDAWMRARREVKASSAAASRTTDGAGRLRRDGSPERVVLVIDDEELVRDTLADFLEDEGFVVLLASDGAEALKLLASVSPRPSLIILDLKMPNLDGWHFQEKQARDPNLASIPVIVVTAAPDANVDAAAVLRKPLRLAQLANTIDSLLEKGTGARDEARRRTS